MKVKELLKAPSFFIENVRITQEITTSAPANHSFYLFKAENEAASRAVSCPVGCRVFQEAAGTIQDYVVVGI